MLFSRVLSVRWHTKYDPSHNKGLEYGHGGEGAGVYSEMVEQPEGSCGVNDTCEVKGGLLRFQVRAILVDASHRRPRYVIFKVSH